MSIGDFLAPEGWVDAGGGPRYARLRQRLEAAMDEGLLPPGAPLPPEREIAALTGLSRVTVRRAIHALVERGLVEQKQGSGSFVTPRPKVLQSLTRLTSFSEDMAQRGLVTRSIWLERGLFLPGADEAQALSLAPEAQVARIARLRLSGGQPMALERASLPPDLLPVPTAVTTSLYEVLDAQGNRPVRATQKISAVNLGRADADRLGVAEHAAGLRIERVSYLATGRVVEFTRSLYRGDAYDFVAELQIATPQETP
ncbi:GntR family transcriptional regulator [Meridianimarinicoccus roseus]|uniref:GntR family transcriptional regulator n=1 Tax=Meridianimarinicoccus roseus TaxID=2072018 RepID=A0A2V2LBS2_9RHOB|nr:GntR family transcriptional regulator [Meridianimarinicoccus roseus]PWR00974.1 GntR family transcriptional regulator [Meridianimarinicoccus roseus]